MESRTKERSLRERAIDAWYAVPQREVVKPRLSFRQKLTKFFNKPFYLTRGQRQPKDIVIETIHIGYRNHEVQKTKIKQKATSWSALVRKQHWDEVKASLKAKITRYKAIWTFYTYNLTHKDNK
jgi:hypothetical protein